MTPPLSQSTRLRSCNTVRSGIYVVLALAAVVLVFWLGARYGTRVGDALGIGIVTDSAATAAPVTVPTTTDDGQTAVDTNPAEESDACAGESNLDMATCAQESFERTDAELNKTYAAAMRVFDDHIAAKYDVSGDYGALRAQLVDTERSWIAYRDGICSVETGSMMSPDGQSPVGGSLSRVLYPGCRESVTKYHITRLQSIIEAWGDH